MSLNYVLNYMRQEVVALHSSKQCKTKERQREKKYNINYMRIACWSRNTVLNAKPREYHAV